MRAAVYHGSRDIRIEDLEVPDPGPGELLIEVHAAGICGTDASEWSHGPTMFPISTRDARSGHLGPMVPGHEFGGRVAARGDGVKGFPDDAIVASGAGISCGTCPACTQMLTNFCERYFTVGLQRDGALAQYVTVPASICLPVEQHGLGDDGAALVQPMSVAVHALRQGSPSPGDTVVVLGIGGVGAFLVFAAAEMGLRVVAADLSAQRLEIASALGAAGTVAVDRDEDLAPQLLRALEGPAVVAYEVTGVAEALQGALAVVKPRGRVVAVGLGARPVPINVRSITLREVSLVGTNAHVFGADFAEAARLVGRRSGGWGDVAPVALPLDALVPRGLQPMVDGRAERIKTLIDPWATEVRPTGEWSVE